VLVGTSSVRESEALAAALGAAAVPCVVLNAKHDEDEAAIVARAGAPGAVTISTNMAGRGTDIRLGGPDEAHRDAVVALGGLYVLGTSRHESLRIDGQLRGRAGRQGDPGATRFFVSIDDDLFTRYGLTESLRRHGRLDVGGPPDSPAVRDAIAHAQRVVDGQHFDMRRTLCRYSSLVEIQRRRIADRRRSILGGESVLERVAPDVRRLGVARLGAETLAAIERRVALHHLDHVWSDHLAWIQDTRESIHLVSLGGKIPLDEFHSQVTGEFLTLPSRIEEAVLDDLRAVIDDGASPEALLARLQAPASTWTYLVNDEPFGSGVSLLKTGNLGKAAGAALYVGPLLILSLILERLRCSKRMDR
jgi:preprotein translocase subunit SecA